MQKGPQAGTWLTSANQRALMCTHPHSSSPDNFTPEYPSHLNPTAQEFVWKADLDLLGAYPGLDGSLHRAAMQYNNTSCSVNTIKRRFFFPDLGENGQLKIR